MSSQIPRCSRLAIVSHVHGVPKIVHVSSGPCAKCKHFRPNNIYTAPNNTVEGSCMLFGDEDMVTGVESFQRAGDVRRDDRKCGREGTLFQRETTQINIWFRDVWFRDNSQILFHLSFTVAITVSLLTLILKSTWM